ncbi:MAG TPA: hypothetical protein VGO04_13805 [Ensifer sp.]|nr:hypothetical protein [Ensifer sp.]
MIWGRWSRNPRSRAINYFIVSLMIAAATVTLAVAGLPSDRLEAEHHDARKGSIIEITNCPDMPEMMKVNSVG